MGIQDRDYWKDRYNKSESASRPNTMDPQYWQREKPFSGAHHEMSFVAKLVITIVLLLMAAMAYRYQSQIGGQAGIKPVLTHKPCGYLVRTFYAIPSLNREAEGSPMVRSVPPTFAA